MHALLLSLLFATAGFHGDRLQPYTNRWHFSAARPGEAPRLIGDWFDELTAGQRDGRKVLTRTQTVKYAKNGHTTTTVNVFDAGTLAPIERSGEGGDGGRTHVTFSRDVIHFGHQNAGQAAMTEATIEKPPPLFDFYGGMYGLLLAAAPLAPDYSGTFTSLGEAKPELREVSFHVAGKETVALPDGKQVETFLVDVDDPDGPMRFWIARQAPYIIRLRFTGGRGMTWSYEMF
jgi:hypothetical protein